jgi:hypothetical protein
MTEQRLSFLELTGGKTSDGHALARYACQCGGETIVARTRVKNGYTRSCGCLAAENKPGLRHGKRHSPEYSSWSAMRTRCNNPSSKDYPRWGGLGISVCDRWENFEAFLEDMGPRPAGTSIDRIDASKNYEPGNCRWATNQDQQRNRRGSMEWIVKGESFPTAKAAADRFGVTEQSVRRWVFGSADPRRGTTTPPMENCHATPRY